MNKVTIAEQKLTQITFPQVEVSYNQIADRLSKIFVPGDLKEYLALYEKAQANPKEALPKILLFKKKHADLPEINNLLSYTFIRRKKIKKAEKLIEENYKKNPDYLFARINYADLCLRKNQSSQIPKIFNHKKTLNEVYPQRTSYHFSELIGFICLMGFYYLNTGQKELAMDYCAYARLIDPDDDTLYLLEKKLYKRSYIESIMSALKPKKR